MSVYYYRFESPTVLDSPIIFFSIILNESIVSQRFIVDCYISLYHIILLPLLTDLGFT